MRVDFCSDISLAIVQVSLKTRHSFKVTKKIEGRLNLGQISC